MGLNDRKLHQWHIGNPPAFGIMPPDEVRTQIAERLSFGYTPAEGTAESIDAVFALHSNQGYQALKRENVFLTDGISEGIRMVNEACIQPGDISLQPAPNYPLHRLRAHQADAVVVHYHCDEKNNWAPDVEDIRSKVNGRTRVIVLINPNNPTGATYSKETLFEILEI